MSTSSRKVVIIRRPTRLDQLIQRFNTKLQAKYYIEHLDGDFSDYEAENDQYRRSLDTLVAGIEPVSRFHLIDWLQAPQYQFNPDDVVMTMGQDGLIVNTLKYLNSQPIIGFNSDRQRWDGVLSQFDPANGARILEATKAVVRLSDQQVLYAVNDFFVGVSNHSSARYKITLGSKTERHSSSGVIVSTPLGRSGWLKSVITGAAQIVNSMSKTPLRIEAKNSQNWSAEQLYFAVREPFPSVNSSTDLVFGRADAGTSLSIESLMGEGGLIFSDGMQSDFLNFNYSVKAEFSIAPTKGILVVRN